MSKFLIAGLGNIGQEYAFTRHNVGFLIADALAASLAKDENTTHLFRNEKLASVCEVKYKSRILCIVKPSTYMNLSGKAVNYWLQFAKIPLENLLVVTDDLALPFGTLRLRKKGSDGGHNGLTDIISTLQTENFARLRFGIGSEFSKGRQVDYVLGQWSEAEQKMLQEKIDQSVQIIKSFVSIGPDRTMTEYNKNA